MLFHLENVLEQDLVKTIMSCVNAVMGKTTTNNVSLTLCHTGIMQTEEVIYLLAKCTVDDFSRVDFDGTLLTQTCV